MRQNGREPKQQKAKAVESQSSREPKQQRAKVVDRQSGTEPKRQRDKAVQSQRDSEPKWQRVLVSQTYLWYSEAVFACFWSSQIHILSGDLLRFDVVRYLAISRYLTFVQVVGFRLVRNGVSLFVSLENISILKCAFL